MRYNDVIDAINELRGYSDIIMDRIANYIEANIDDFMECYSNMCPECNELGYDTEGGRMECGNGHAWYPDEL